MGKKPKFVAFFIEAFPNCVESNRATNYEQLLVEDNKWFGGIFRPHAMPHASMIQMAYCTKNICPLCVHAYHACVWWLGGIADELVLLVFIAVCVVFLGTVFCFLQLKDS